jgi:hypothetical protein
MCGNNDRCLIEGGVMRRFGFGLVVLTALFASASACQRRPDVSTPTVTAKGSAGEEDVPELTLRQVSLKAGETLLVSCSDEGGDAEVYWGDAPLHADVASHGTGLDTKIFSLYSATGGTADIVASHLSGGDLTFNAYAVTNLAPSALDKMAAAQGRGTSPSSGATGATSRANEFVWGTIGYFFNDQPTGTWIDGFTPGGQIKGSGGIGGVEDGYKTVSSTGAYTAAKTGIKEDTWTAAIATYAISSVRDATR